VTCDATTASAPRDDRGRRQYRLSPHRASIIAAHNTTRESPFRPAIASRRPSRAAHSRHSGASLADCCRNRRATAAAVAEPAGFADSFFTGPLGNIGPDKTTGTLLGTWLPGVPRVDMGAAESSCSSTVRPTSAASTTLRTSITPRRSESATGSRSFPTHAPRGAPTLATRWSSPGPKTSEVDAGLADARPEEVGARFAAWNKPVLLRIYWEFNGDWMNWSGSGKACISAWKRTVNTIRAAGGTNVGFVCSPASGYRDRPSRATPATSGSTGWASARTTRTRPGPRAALTNQVHGASCRIS
jgi:hypothetical protein